MRVRGAQRRLRRRDGPDDARAPFSNFGATSVDLFAPGADDRLRVPAARASHLDRYFGTGPATR